MNMAQVAYEELGPKLDAHLKDKFRGESYKDMYDKFYIVKDLVYPAIIEYKYLANEIYSVLLLLFE